MITKGFPFITKLVCGCTHLLKSNYLISISLICLKCRHDVTKQPSHYFDAAYTLLRSYILSFRNIYKRISIVQGDIFSCLSDMYTTSTIKPLGPSINYVCIWTCHLDPPPPPFFACNTQLKCVGVLTPRPST